MSDTISQLYSQLANPSDVTTVLMIIGGDVVQKALAQTTGCWYTPVCFSFGWVAYTFMALVGVLGDGRLLPSPDYPVKVFNLRSGYVRDNRNWVIGRLLRDHGTYISRRASAPSAGIRITVWEAKDNTERKSKTSFSYSTIHIWGLAITFTQLAIAAIPLILNGRWGILFITGVGTLLALIAGGLPQWRAEKLPNRQNSKKAFALTTGNGSKDIMVIIGAGRCLDLEDLSAQETPRSAKPWEKFQLDETQHTITLSVRGHEFTEKSQRRMRSSNFPTVQLRSMLTKSVRGLPGGFALTMIVCVAQSVLWLLLLIVVAALDTDTWYLILVGAIGMFQNGYLAAMERAPGHSNCPLAFQGVITTSKVMDGLMDLEVVFARQVAPSYNISEPFMMPLVKEFFPGRLRPDEEDWWRGERFNYDQSRLNNMELRGFPRSAPLSRKSTARSDFEQKQPRNSIEKRKGIRDENKYNIFDKSQSGGARSAQDDAGLSSERDRKVEQNFSARPKSPPQAHLAGIGQLLEHSAGESAAELAHVTPNPPRAAQFRPSNVPTTYAQRFSRPQPEETADHTDEGYTLPMWS